MLKARSLAAVLLAVALAPLAAAQTKDPAALAPADAIVFVGVGSFEEMWAAYEKTASYRMLQDPAAKDIMKGADIVGKVGEKLKERLAKVLDVPAAQIKNPFKGAIAFWLTAPKGADEEPEPGLVADVGDKEAMRKYYDAAVKKLKETSSSYESVSAGSNTIEFFKQDKSADDDAGADDEDESAEDESAEEPEDEISQMLDQAFEEVFSSEALPPSLAICLTEERLYVGPTPDAVRDALRREKGGETLAETDEYKQLQREFKPTGQVRVLINAGRMLDAALKEEPEGEEMINALGLKSLRSIIGHVHFGGEDYDSKMEFLAVISGERTGLLKILSMENRPVAQVNAPAETIAYFSMNMNLLSVLDEAERIIRKIDPGTADAFRQSLDEAPAPPGGAESEKLSPRKDVLEHLREPLTGFFAAAAPYDGQSARFAFSIAHRNRAALEKFLGYIQNLMPGMMNQHEVRGSQVVDIPMFGMSIAVLSDKLMLGNTPTIENAATSSEAAEGLAADAAFKSTVKLAPDEAWGMFYVDSRDMWEAMAGFGAKKDELDAGAMNATSALGQMLASMAATNFKEGKAEEARKLIKYQAPQIFTIANTTAGLRVTAIQAKPKAE